MTLPPLEPLAPLATDAAAASCGFEVLDDQPPAIDPCAGGEIILGPESDLDDLGEISLVSSPYRRGDTLLGVLGVIGPLRMDYSRIIPVVEFTANLLSELMEQPEDG